MKYTLPELIDIDDFQELLQSYAAVSGLTCALVDIQGNFLARAGWQNICTHFHNAHPEMDQRCQQSDLILVEKLQKEESCQELCLNGLWNTAASIVIEGETVGEIYAGQFFKEPPDEEAFKTQARKFNLDEEAYITALRDVPIISEERLETIMFFFRQMAKNLASMGLEHLRTIEANEKREAAEKARVEIETFYRRLVEGIKPVIYLNAADDVRTTRYISPQIEALVGYSAEEWIYDQDLWLRIVHPQDIDRVLAENERTNRTGEPYNLEYRMIARNSRTIWVRDQSERITSGWDDMDGWWGLLTEISAEKEALGMINTSAQRLEILMDLNQMAGLTEKEVTKVTLEGALKLTDSTIGYIAFVNEDETRMHMMAWSESAMQECKIVDKPLDYRVDEAGLWGEAIRQRKAIITNDYMLDNPAKKGVPAGHVNLIRHMNTPVFDNGKIVVVVGVGNKATGYTETDVQQLSSLVEGMWGIILRRRAQEALQQRIMTLTNPVWDLADLRFEDLFDLEEIQEIQDAFSDATGVGSIITDVKGTPITASSNFCALCEDIIRHTKLGLENCRNSDDRIREFPGEETNVHRCMSGGLWDACSPITVGGRHIANWFIGQVLDESVNEEEMMAYAREIGADEDAYRNALRQVKRMSVVQFRHIAQSLSTIARKLSLSALQNVQQARTIAERQEAESTLDKERLLLRTLIQNLPDAIYIKDAKGRKTLSNPADLFIIGVDREDEVLGKDDLELFGPILGEKTYRDDMEIIASGKPKLRYEESIIDRHGTQRWLQTSKVPIFDEEGKVIQLMGIGRDVTDLQNTMDALKRERNLLRAFTDNTPDQIFVKDRDSRFVLCNPAIARAMSCSSPEDMIGKTDFDYHTPELASQFYQQEQHLMRTGEPIIGEEQHYLNANGKMRWMITTKVPWRNELGEIIGLVGINHDNTERKVNEDTIVRERNLLRVLVEHIPDQIYVKDLQNRFVLANQNLADDFNLRSYELLGKTDFDLHPQDFAVRYFEEEQRVLSKGEIISNLERWDLLPTGERKWIGVTKVPWHNEKGEIMGLVGINHDLTDRKRSEDEIRDLNARLEQRVQERTAELTAANRELEDFAYSVSHDLRSPLRGIDGFSQALLEEYAQQLEDTGRHYLERIRAGSQRMGQIIDDLLKLSRVTRVNLQRERVDLTGLVKTILFDYKMNQPERKVETIVQSDMTVEADPNLIRMVMNNLLDNAWKFTSKQPTARIEVGLVDMKGQNVYFVRDDGVGFDMSYIDKLFGTFQRLHHLTEYNGTGIGLAIVQRVIQRHGGTVWAESMLGKGTTIYFTL